MEWHDGVYGPDGGKFDYQMVKIKAFTDPMSRQVAEATHIRRLEAGDESEDVHCLNSRLDWVKTAWVSLVTTMGAIMETPAS